MKCVYDDFGTEAEKMMLALSCAPVALGRAIYHRWTRLLFSHVGIRSHWSLPAMNNPQDHRLIGKSISKTPRLRLYILCPG